MHRRDFLLGSAAMMAAGFLPAIARANVPVPYDWNASPPTDARASFVDWMIKNRGENPDFLGQRFDRFQDMIVRHDIWRKSNKSASSMQSLP